MGRPDRVEATSGLGYALDNRLLLSRILPNTLNHVGTQRLLPFVEHFCTQTEALAKHNRHHPHVALLSPGRKMRPTTSIFWRAISGSPWPKART